MLNRTRKLAFKSYMNFVEPLPIRRGKISIARVLTRLFGRAVYRVNGVNMELDPTSIIDKRLISGQGHDNIVMELIHDQLSNGGVFVDVGANIGYFSLLAARIPNVHVLAFEPSPRELERLYINMTLNRLPGNVTIYPYGLSDEIRVIPLHLSGDANPTMNSVANLGRFMKFVETVNCNFMPFDVMVTSSRARQVRLCKIDVEGYELSVLRGFAASIDQMREATFIIEVSPAFLAETGHRPSDIYDFFERHGFVPRFGLKEKGSQYDEVFSTPEHYR